MAIEIYLQPELEELVITPEKKEEWETKIEELGLDGQKKLTKNSHKDAASPYTFMNEQMKLVFQTLCPTRAEVEKYDKSVIPIDILSHVALCKQEGYFAKLEIWYDNKSPDPILIGYLTNTYGSPLHLIGRWGDEIIPYEQLVEKAIRRYTESFKLSVQSTMSQCKEILEDADLRVKQLFSGQKSVWDIQPRYDLTLQNSDLPF